MIATSSIVATGLSWDITKDNFPVAFPEIKPDCQNVLEGLSPVIQINL